MAKAKDLFNIPGQDDDKGLYDPDNQGKKDRDLVAEQKERFGAQPDAGVKAAEENVKDAPNEKERDISAAGLRAEERKSLYTPEEKGEFKRASLRVRIKNIPARRKALGFLGVGGIAGLILTVMTIGPLYRVPSLMHSMLNFTGDGVEHVVENRAQRIVIGYLIHRVGGNPNNYVITGSPLGTLWATFRSEEH